MSHVVSACDADPTMNRPSRDQVCGVCLPAELGDGTRRHATVDRRQSRRRRSAQSETEQSEHHARTVRRPDRRRRIGEEAGFRAGSQVDAPDRSARRPPALAPLIDERGLAIG
jgi:hypothetical protein